MTQTQEVNMVRGWLLGRSVGGVSATEQAVNALAEAVAILRDIPRGAVSAGTDKRISDFLTKIGYE